MLLIVVIISIVVLTLAILFYTNDNTSVYTCTSSPTHTDENRLTYGREKSGIIQLRNLAAPGDVKKYKVNVVKSTNVPPPIPTDDQEPAQVMLNYRTFMPPVLDQGSLGSCIINAFVNVLFFVEQNTQPTSTSIKLGLNQPTQLRSRMYIFYYELTQYGHSDTNFERTAATYQKWGAPHESLWPYNDDDFFTSDGSIVVRDDTFLRPLREKSTSLRTLNYFSVPVKPLNHNILRNALRKYGPLLISVICTTAWQQVKSDGIIQASSDEIVVGGHAIILVGYDSIKSMYTIMNSWSTNWGDGGYAYVPYSSMDRYILEAMAFSLNPVGTMSPFASIKEDSVSHPCGSILQANRNNWIEYHDEKGKCVFSYCSNPDVSLCGSTGGTKYMGCDDKNTSMANCYKADITSPVYEIADGPCTEAMKSQKRLTGYASSPAGDLCYMTYAAPNVAEKDVPPVKNLGCIVLKDDKPVSVDCSSPSPSPKPRPRPQPSKQPPPLSKR